MKGSNGRHLVLSVEQGEERRGRDSLSLSPLSSDYIYILYTQTPALSAGSSLPILPLDPEQFSIFIEKLSSRVEREEERTKGDGFEISRVYNGFL